MSHPVPDGDAKVAEWLAHPVAGEVMREMLAEGGQSERALAPVRRFSMNKLIKISGGRFSQEMLDGMIAETARRMAGGVAPGGEGSGAPPASTAVEGAAPAGAPEPVEAEEWEERVTPGRFDGMTVVVTGAGSGIGRATASRVAREGGRVIAVDISAARLEELRGDHPGSEVITVTADVTSEADVARVIAAAGERVDALANVAGIMDNMTPLHEVSDEVWQRVFAVNVEGVMRLSRAALGLMVPAGRGSIVNIASEAGLRGSAAGAAYTASKHAVIGITRSASYMYAGHGIRVNAVAPGPVITNIEARFDSALGQERIEQAMAILPTPVTPDQLAASICFLLSDDAVNLTGVVLPSDGGWSAI